MLNITNEESAVVNQEHFMQVALKIAKKAYKKQEIPIGAVIVLNGKIIATGYNKREKKRNALCHAEIIAINKACKKLKNWRLNNCEIYVTVEPCIMCLGAIYNSRIKALYYGSKNTSCSNVEIDYNKQVLNHNLVVHGGVLQNECTSLLKSFFSKTRQ